MAATRRASTLFSAVDLAGAPSITGDERSFRSSRCASVSPAAGRGGERGLTRTGDPAGGRRFSRGYPDAPSTGSVPWGPSARRAVQHNGSRASVPKAQAGEDAGTCVSIPIRCSASSAKWISKVLNTSTQANERLLTICSHARMPDLGRARSYRCNAPGVP